MSKRNTTAPAINALTTVQGFRAFDDASGATATVSYKGYTFACNWLANVSLNLIRPVCGSRRENKIAAEVCRAAFVATVLEHTTEAWREACAVMYDAGN